MEEGDVQMKNMKTQSCLDITTIMGCPVNCIRYCPQEIILARYKGERVLTLEAFQNLIETVPTSTAIIIGGVSEPFRNQECADMVLYAYSKGHEVIIFSTLVGLKPEDAERILDIPFMQFMLHLPDAEGNAKIPMTDDYFKTLGMVLTRVHNIVIMNMGNSFVSGNPENIARGRSVPVKPYRVDCFRLHIPNHMVTPNGEMSLCCETKGLTGRVGNLFEKSYTELTSEENFGKMARKMQQDPEGICRKCSFSRPYYLYSILNNDWLVNKPIELYRRWF